MPTQPQADTREPKTERIALRASSRQEQVIRRAAAATDRTVTDFILDTAVEHAERVLADRRWFLASEDQWREFEKMLEEPLPAKNKFLHLASRPSPFSA